MNQPQIMLLVAVINFAAAFFQGAAGFGYALMAMALMPLFLPMSVCSAISAVTVVVIGLQMTLALCRELQWRLIVLPVFSCLTTINLGLYLLDQFDELLLRIILACLLLLVTAIFFIMRRRQLVLPNRWYTAVGAGHRHVQYCGAFLFGLLYECVRNPLEYESQPRVQLPSLRALFERHASVCLSQHHVGGGTYVSHLRSGSAASRRTWVESVPEDRQEQDLTGGLYPVAPHGRQSNHHRTECLIPFVKRNPSVLGSWGGLSGCVAVVPPYLCAVQGSVNRTAFPVYYDHGGAPHFYGHIS